MKALMRNPGETITDEEMPDLDWETGMPLTSKQWSGGPYRLIDDYVPPRFDDNGEMIADNRDAEIAALKARLATLEKGL